MSSDVVYGRPWVSDDVLVKKVLPSDKGPAIEALGYLKIFDMRRQSFERLVAKLGPADAVHLTAALWRLGHAIGDRPAMVDTRDGYIPASRLALLDSKGQLNFAQGQAEGMGFGGLLVGRTVGIELFGKSVASRTKPDVDVVKPAWLSARLELKPTFGPGIDLKALSLKLTSGGEVSLGESKNVAWLWRNGMLRGLKADGDNFSNVVVGDRKIRLDQLDWSNKSKELQALLNTGMRFGASLKPHHVGFEPEQIVPSSAIESSVFDSAFRSTLTWVAETALRRTAYMHQVFRGGVKSEPVVSLNTAGLTRAQLKPLSQISIEAHDAAKTFNRTLVQLGLIQASAVRRTSRADLANADNYGKGVTNACDDLDVVNQQIAIDLFDGPSQILRGTDVLKASQDLSAKLTRTLSFAAHVLPGLDLPDSTRPLMKRGLVANIEAGPTGSSLAD